MAIVSHGAVILRCREAATAYWGLCLHIGQPMPQNRHGHLIGHVRNTAKDPHSPDTRIYSTARAQPCAADPDSTLGARLVESLLPWPQLSTSIEPAVINPLTSFPSTLIPGLQAALA